MKTWIALFRGINVGGKNKLRMADLRECLTDAGLGSVRTCIQSGNVVFEGAGRDSLGWEQVIAGAVQSEFDMQPHIIVFEHDQLKEAIKRNPFAAANADTRVIHFFFLASPASDPDLKKLESLRAGKEQFQLINQVFYLLAPDGIGRSKLATAVERFLGVAVTARNLATIEKLNSLAASAP